MSGVEFAVVVHGGSLPGVCGTLDVEHERDRLLLIWERGRGVREGVSEQGSEGCGSDPGFGIDSGTGSEALTGPQHGACQQAGRLGDLPGVDLLRLGEKFVAAPARRGRLS